MEATSPRKRKIREERRPACDECRAHKLRCDAFLDYSRPCSRCLKKQVKCIISEERRKKTLPVENHDVQSMSSPSKAVLQPRKAQTFGAHYEAYITRASDSMLIQSSPISSYVPPTPPSVTESGRHAPSTSVPVDVIGTRSRILENLQVEAIIIDICFAHFNRYYAPLVPILESKPRPNETFHESPFKFWVIVSIGSRKCLEDPTLFPTLSPRVETLAMTSLRPVQKSPYPIIEALLLMCTWHLSTDQTFFRSIYFTISSAVVTLSLQAGMHRCLSLQAISWGKFDGLPDLARGTKLWAYAVISNQSAMAINGYPIDEPLASRHLSSGNECCATLPGWIIYQGRILAIVTKAHRVASDLELETDLIGQSKALKSLIAAFEAELLELHGNIEPEGPLSKLRFVIARLQIRSLVFLTIQDDIDLIDLTQLSNAAISTIDTIIELDSTIRVLLHCPGYVFHGVVLAACTLLRLIKSYSKRASNEKDQTKAFFSAINICKEISVVNNDTSAKISQILSGLWSSTKIYKNEQGDSVRSLQVRNRLTMSVVFDCIWWSRKLSTNWLIEQPVPSNYHASGQAPDPSQCEENTNSFSQHFDDEYWNWDLDWGSIDFPGVMD